MVITFHDIAATNPNTGTTGTDLTTFAPNPWKTRYALNFKNKPYKTSWTDLPDVAAVRKDLSLPANRIHRDGSPFYTLPIIEDSETGEKVGDSFEIAVYLDQTYPSSSSTLFPSKNAISLYSAFNTQVDSIFSQFWGLFIHGLPFNPSTAEKSKAEFVFRAGVQKWEDLGSEGRRGRGYGVNLRVSWGRLLGLILLLVVLVVVGGFLEGGEVPPSYADFIVGAWLKFFKTTVSEEEWVRMCSWHDGLWGRVYDGLEKWAEIK